MSDRSFDGGMRSLIRGCGCGGTLELEGLQRFLGATGKVVDFHRSGYTDDLQRVAECSVSR